MLRTISLLPFLGLLLMANSGCGTNKFQQEVETDKVAVALARQTKSGDYELLTAEELKGLLDKDTPMLLIDTMPYEDSYQQNHIPGAKQFLFPKKGEMETWDSEATGGKSEDDYNEFLGEDKEKLIVVYCGFVKCKRSHNGAMWARKLGYTNVKRFPGGIYAWKGAGYSTESD